MVDSLQQDAETDDKWWGYMADEVPRNYLKTLGVTNPREFGNSYDALLRGREMFIFAAEATRAAKEQGKSDLFGVTIRPGPLVDPRDSQSPRTIEVSTRAGDVEKKITIRAGITEGDTSHAEVLDYMGQVYTMAKMAGVSSPGMNVNYNAGEAEIVKAGALHEGVSQHFNNSTHPSVPPSASEPVINNTSSGPGEPATRVPAPVFNTQTSPQTVTVRGREYVVDPAKGEFATTVFNPRDEEMNVFSKLDYLVRGFANAVTFGMADRLAGAMDTALYGGDLQTNIQVERAVSNPDHGEYIPGDGGARGAEGAYQVGAAIGVTATTIGGMIGGAAVGAVPGALAGAAAVLVAEGAGNLEPDLRVTPRKLYKPPAP
jgi:hypothetical protein